MPTNGRWDLTWRLKGKIANQLNNQLYYTGTT